MLLGGRTGTIEWVSLVLRKGDFEVAFLEPTPEGIRLSTPWPPHPALDTSAAYPSLEVALTATGARALVLDTDDCEAWADPTTVLDGSLPCGVVLLSSFGFHEGAPRGSDLAVAAASGMMHLTGASRDPIGPPEMLCEFQTDTISGSHAAMAVMSMALQSRPGMGIEVCKHESMALCCAAEATKWTYSGLMATRRGQPSFQPSEVVSCADGDVFVICPNQQQWERFVEAIGSPEWAAWEIFATRESRAAAWDILEPRITEALSELTRDDFMQMSLDHRLPFALCNTPEQAADLAEELTGSPDVTSWLYQRRAAPETGRPARPMAGVPGRPLDGVTVLDLSTVWATPYSTNLLASHGARVIKVETRAKLDHGRNRVGELSLIDEGLEEWNRKGTFRETNQGKESITVNVSAPEGQALLHELAKQADILTANFTPGVEGRFHLSDEELWAVNPQLIIGRLSAYDRHSRMGSLTGYGYGMLLMNGFGYNGEGRPWIDRSIAFPDPQAGTLLAFAMMRALDERSHTGRGAVIEIDLFGPSAAIHRFYDRDQTDPHRGLELPAADFMAILPARDGEWITITCPTAANTRRLANAFGPDGQSALDRGYAALRAWLQQRFEPWDSQELQEYLRRHGVVAQRVYDLRQLVREAGLVESGLLRVPAGEVHLHASSPWVVDGERLDTDRRAPYLGERTAEVLGELLGLDEAAVADLAERQVAW